MLEMRQAAKTWNSDYETLEQIEARIHDGWPVEKLHERGDRRIATMFEVAPFIPLPSAYSALEVGPGVGYLMQALDRHKPAGSITGLDVAANMADHARSRMKRDSLTAKPFRFETYDGIDFPFDDNTFDLAYSIAVIQHIPKPFAYNIFLEMTRVVKPTGVVCVQLLSEKFLTHESCDFRKETRQQVTGSTGHWHHFYTRTEMEAVLRHGIKVPFFHLSGDGDSFWAVWSKSLQPWSP